MLVESSRDRLVPAGNLQRMLRRDMLSQDRCKAYVNGTRNGEAIPLRINRRSKALGVSCDPCREKRKRAFVGGWEGAVESRSSAVRSVEFRAR
jgi:hypothetical protein